MYKCKYLYASTQLAALDLTKGIEPKEVNCAVIDNT